MPTAKLAGDSQTFPKKPARSRSARRLQRSNRGKTESVFCDRDAHPPTKQSEQARLVLRTGLYARKVVFIKLKTASSTRQAKISRGFETDFTPNFYGLGVGVGALTDMKIIRRNTQQNRKVVISPKSNNGFATCR